MKRLGLPEMIVIGVVAVLAFGPRALPKVSEIIQDVRRTAGDNSYPLSLRLAFGLFLVMAFIYGVVSTIDLFH